MFTSSASSEEQRALSKRPQVPSSSASLARADTIKASYFDGGEGEGGKEERSAAAAAAAGRGEATLEKSSGSGLDLPPPSSPSLPASAAAATAAAASASRLSRLEAELLRLQKNQAVLQDALERGRAVLVASSSASPSSASSSASHHLHHSTLRGALADPPLVDPSPGAQAAHKRKLRRQEARTRGGASSSSEFVSGGLTGFAVAEDLLRVDFAAVASDDAPPTPREFRAAAFDEPQPKQALRSLRSLRSQAAELLPAGDPKLASFLKQLEARQRLILKVLLAESKASGNDGDGVGKGVVLSPLLKNPLARLAEAGMTVPDDEGTAATDRF